MLKDFIPKLVKDLDLGDATLESGMPGIYTLPLDEGLAIHINEIPNEGGVLFKCAVAPFPKVREDVFSTNAMLANLFGQGTRGAVLGLSLDGNTLTLSRAIDYHIDYKEFKEILEEFINTVDFWRAEALNHK